jgi:hypothetical protein
MMAVYIWEMDEVHEVKLIIRYPLHLLCNVNTACTNPTLKCNVNLSFSVKRLLGVKRVPMIVESTLIWLIVSTWDFIGRKKYIIAA